MVDATVRTRHGGPERVPTIRYCPFCEQEHTFHIQFDADKDTFELWCSWSGLLVEKVVEEEQSDRFFELKWQFVPPVNE